jgi:hypothetical protein
MPARTPMAATSRAGRGSRVAALAITVALVIAACSGGDDAAGDRGGDTDRATTQAAPTTTTIDLPDPAEMSDEDLAAETYVAGYPLVVSTRTMQRLGGLLGINTLFWQSELSGPESRIIVAPNRDTLYSVAVLDLRSEPMVLTLPEVTDRYSTYQLLSPWTESFAYIGTRATEGRAGTWVIAPPGWEGEVPEGADVIESPTPQVFLLGRFLVDDEADVANVQTIRDEASMVPLSEATGDGPAPPPPPLGEPAGTAQAIPGDASFFPELAKALAVNPPATAYQEQLFAEAEERFTLADPSADAAAVLDAGAVAAAERIAAQVAERSDVVGGWGLNLDVGTYGDDLDLRAFVARVGWGANVAEEAVYPVARVDGDGAALDGLGGRTYEITFDPGELPPLDDLGFWSLSAYGGDMFFAPHPSGRYTIGDRTAGLPVSDDGSLTLTLAHDEPASGVDGWLPVPDGPFVLMLRLYLPAAEVLDGSWAPPPIEPTDA